MKSRARLSAVAGALFVMLSRHACEAVEASEASALQDAIPRVRQAVPRLMAAGDVVGLQIVLIEGYRVRWQHGFGVAKRGTNQRMDDQTIFEAASLAKPMLGYAALQLVERGLLDLDVPLATYVGTGPPVGGQPDARANLITARMVLSHTTGFQNEIQPGEVLRVHFQPGARFSYSGEGFHYLQRAMERISGERLDALLERMIFAPFGMKSASFAWRDTYELHKAHGHDTAGAPAERIKPTDVRLSWLHITAADYAKFVTMVMSDIRAGNSATRLMITPQVPVSEDCVFCLGPGAERRSRTLAWGLGWGLEHAGKRTAIWHWGENRGEFQHFVIAYPHEGIGVVIFTNSGNGFSIIPEVVSAALGGDVPSSFAWLRYERYDSTAKVLYRDILGRGAVAIDEYVRTSRGAGQEKLSERQVNQIGYWLLSNDRADDAVRLFQLNVERHPESWNAYDSLAEAHLIRGERALAIRNYQKAVELNPLNRHGVEQLRRLERSQAERQPK